VIHHPGGTHVSGRAKIISILTQPDVHYEVRTRTGLHQPHHGRRTAGKESETVKSLVLLTREKEMVVLVLPGDKKVDWKKAATGIGTKKVAFAKPEDILAKVGCEVGACRRSATWCRCRFTWIRISPKRSSFIPNPGVHHKSYKIKSWDLQKSAKPKML
jgi:Ala-tRNA(Pro) deacylase